MRVPALGGIRVLWLQWTNSQGLLSPVEEKGQHGHSLKRRAPRPLPNLHRNTGHIWKAHQSLSGSNNQIDNKQRTLRAYSESGSVS